MWSVGMISQRDWLVRAVDILLRSLPGQEHAYTVYSSVGQFLIRIGQGHRCCCVILDVSPSMIPSLLPIKRIRAADRNIAILTISEVPVASSLLQRIFDAGADGFCTLSSGGEVVSEVIELAVGQRRAFDVIDDERYFTPIIRPRWLFDEFVSQTVRNGSKRSLLSKREEQVLALISEGLTTSEIAETLKIKDSTVQVYRKRLAMKLETTNTALQTRIALRLMLTSLIPLEGEGGSGLKDSSG